MAPVKIRQGFRQEPAGPSAAGAIVVGTLIVAITIVLLATIGAFA